MLIFTQKAWLAFQCLTALSLLPIAPCLSGLMGWLMNIAVSTSECVAVSCWLAGFWAVFGFYLWDVLNRAIQGWGWEGSLGAWDEPEADVHGLWVQPVFLRLWGWRFHSWNMLPIDLSVVACCFWGRLRLAQELLHGSLTLSLRNTCHRESQTSLVCGS